jgi:SRSO17 transposase
VLEHALDAGVPAGWVTADEADGGSPTLRGWLETRQLPYVLAVKATEPLPSPRGPSTSAARLAAQVPPEWLRSSAGQGAKGRRWYAWTQVVLDSMGAPPGWGGGCWSAAACAPGSWPSRWAPARPVCRWSPWSGWPGVAGGWRRRLQASKGLCGLDQHQLRRWRCWYRWVTLAMLAYAFLVVAAVTAHAQRPAPQGRSS